MLKKLTKRIYVILQFHEFQMKELNYSVTTEAYVMKADDYEEIPGMASHVKMKQVNFLFKIQNFNYLELKIQAILQLSIMIIIDDDYRFSIPATVGLVLLVIPLGFILSMGGGKVVRMFRK